MTGMPVTMTSPTAEAISRKDDDHFMTCPGCLARVDIRNLSEVLKHMHPEEARRPASQASDSGPTSA